jgi:two-component system, OmpR family, phosphate regulon sensor histidine kinase PhoR
LTLSRIEDRENKEEISLVAGEVGPVLESAIQTCAVHADEKDIILQVEYANRCALRSTSRCWSRR